MRKIQIYWSSPMKLDAFLESEESKDIGIYYITRIFGNNETHLYIGKTIHSFKSRINLHYEWLSKYRGQIYVRLGRIISPNWYYWEKYQQLISEVEKILIFNMREKLLENTANTVNINISENTMLINLGHRGILNKNIKWNV